MAPPNLDIPTTKVRALQVVGVLLAAGSLSIAFFTPAGKELALPGPLSFAHAPLEESCETCHSKELDAVQHPLAGWVASDLDLSQSRRCVACHDLGEHPLGPHGWSREVARERRAASLGASEPAASFRESAVPLSARGHLACATCHNEHRGRRNDLAHLADAQCQSCHTREFDSFPGGHPEFDAFPYERRTSLHFDHESHIQRHFRSDLQEHAPDSCSDCHVPEEGLAGFRLAPFEETCAGCHEEAIAGTTQVDGAGLSVLSFPALDLLSLEERGSTIGTWPADSAEVETGLPPIMAFLVGTDERARNEVAAFAATDPLDLYEATDDEINAVERFAWTVKRWLERVSEEGHAGWLAMIAERLGREPTERERAGLVAGMPGDLFTRALEEWEVEGESELERLEAGAPPPVRIAEATSSYKNDGARERWMESGGWYVQHSDFTLRYRPTGHADPFFRAWLDVAAESDPALFEALARPEAHGACTKCHAVEDTEAGPRVRWSEEVWSRELSRFEHRPHLTSDGRTDCTTCHVLGVHGGEVSAAFASRDPHGHVSNFEPMTVETCADCHRPGGASNGCLECHDYHAHAPRARIPVPRLDDLLRREAGD